MHTREGERALLWPSSYSYNRHCRTLSCSFIPVDAYSRQGINDLLGLLECHGALTND